MNKIKKLIIISFLIITIILIIYNMISNFIDNFNYVDNDNLLNDNDLLQQKTKIWGDLSDDAVGIIKRMTEPDIGFYPSKMKLFDYYDIIT